MPRRIPCAHPGCTARVDASVITGLCITHLHQSMRAPAPPRPAPRWPVRVAMVPQITTTGADGYNYKPITLLREPWA
jgi:hypothetical protein